MSSKQKKTEEKDDVKQPEDVAEETVEQAETTPPAEETEQAEPVAATVQEAEEPLRDQLLRLRADFDNFRRRTIKERGELSLYANESLFLELLPVIDHFEMGLKSAIDHKTDESVTEGFRMVYNQFIDVFKKFNVTPIDAIGETFDPHRHEALTHLPSDKPAETVIEQVRRGYLLGERLLRAAQVVVSSGPAA